MYPNGLSLKLSENLIKLLDVIDVEAMTSWGPGFVQKKGHSNLAYYHQVGFESFAAEYFKMIRSIMYSQDSLEFLFVFDKVNSYSSYISLFENTLKKNNYIRYLPYYPSQGYNVADRIDLLKPIIDRGPRVDKPDFFKLFVSCFQLQQFIYEKINEMYAKSEIPLTDILVSICLLPDQNDFTSIFDCIQRFSIGSTEPFTVFVHSQRREDAERFIEQCPSSWIVYTMWKTIPKTILTEEQKKNELYSYLGSLLAIVYSRYLVGSHHSPTFRFGYAIKPDFRNQTNALVFDRSSFSIF